ncbi:MAG: N-acetylmuramoyl-L-alanine amidase [Cytophagales bacterium]|nr:N-acetylmuramoyl-L-alanine amidase [Cytophaga sp.]
MADPTTFQINLPAAGRPSNVLITQEWFPRVQDYWAGCTTQRDGGPVNSITAIIIHATAGSTSAGAVTRMSEPDVNNRASFHWLVPDEDESQHGRLIWACTPENLAAWHVRNSASHPDVNNDQKKVNHWSLGIEIVNRQSGGDTFSDWQVKITAQIVRYCWAKYSGLKYIVSHAKLDPDRRNDPGTNFPWDTFKNLVLNPPNTFTKSISFSHFEPADFLGEGDLDDLHDSKQ